MSPLLDESSFLPPGNLHFFLFSHPLLFVESHLFLVLVSQNKFFLFFQAFSFFLPWPLDPQTKGFTWLSGAFPSFPYAKLASPPCEWNALLPVLGVCKTVTILTQRHFFDEGSDFWPAGVFLHPSTLSHPKFFSRPSLFHWRDSCPGFPFLPFFFLGVSCAFFCVCADSSLR